MPIPGKNDAFDLRNRKNTSTVAVNNGIPAGGGAGTILTKNTTTDYDVAWAANTAIQKGDPLYVLVRNNTGATLTKGTIVYTNGATGNQVTVAPALATGDSTSARTLGWVSADILNNDQGYVQIEGILTGIDTTGASADGAIIYLSATTAGGWTTTKPHAPTHLVYCGVVVKKAAAGGGGGVQVKMQNGYELDEIHNVDTGFTNALATGDVLSYDATASLWYNKSLSSAGIASSTHVHGNVTNTGALTTAVTPAAAVKMVITDSTTNLLGTLAVATTPSTQFLRGDGTWVVPTNTTYTFATGTTNGTFNVTPSGGSLQAVPIFGLGSAAYTASTAYVPSTLSTSVTATNPVKVVITDSTNTVGTLTTTGASATTFLRGDGTWATPSGSSLGWIGSTQTTAASGGVTTIAGITQVSGVNGTAVSFNSTSSGAGGISGDLNLYTGDTLGTFASGALTIKTGTPTTGAASAGSISILTGRGGITAGASGTININTGSLQGAGAVGNINIGTAGVTNSAVPPQLNLQGTAVNITGATSVTGALSSTGIISSTATTSGSSNAGAISYGTLSYSDQNNLATFSTSANSYAQMVLQNKATNANASADFTISNDVGTASTFYGNFGMNSSIFSGTGSFNLPNAVYLSSTSGDLVLGTTTANAIRFVVNSGATDVLSISSAGAISAVGPTSISGATTISAASVTGTAGLAHSITGGSSTNANGVGGGISLTAGSATAAGGISSGGSITITAGNGNSTSGAGGTVTINGGVGSTVNGRGAVYIGSANTLDGVMIGPGLTAATDNVVLASTTMGARLKLYAATLNGASPIQFTAQAGIPLLAAGNLDFDGNAFYGTPKVNNTTAGKGLIPTQQYFVPNANTTINSSATAGATISGALMGNKYIYLAASTTYEVEAVAYVQVTWSTSQASNFGLGLSYPTGSTAIISTEYVANASQTTNVAMNQAVLTTTGTFVLSATPTTGTWLRLVMKGIVKTSTTAGNFSPLVAITNGGTAGSVVTITIGANSFIKVNPIAGVGADINIGGWA